MSAKGGYVEILEFTYFSRVFRFNHTGEIGRIKEISHEIKVSMVMEMGMRLLQGIVGKLLVNGQGFQRFL